MFNLLALSFGIAPILLFASVITAQTASANPKVESDTQLAQLQTENNLVLETPIVPVKDILSEQNQQISQDPSTIEQVTSVSQLSDVQPTDWAFGALQSLVERYGCIAGYPNGTFRGNWAMTRYEESCWFECLKICKIHIMSGKSHILRFSGNASITLKNVEIAACQKKSKN